MKFHSTPPPPSPTIHELPLVVYHTFEVDVLDAPIDVLLGSGQGIGQAIPVLEFDYLQTTVVPFLCLGSLSCWKILPSSSISNVSKLSTTPSSNISQYWSAFIFPCTSISFPT